MKTSSLQLEEFLITKLNIEHIEATNKNDTEKFNIKLDYDVAMHADNDNLFRLDFRVKIKPKKGDSGKSIDAELLGFFSFPPNTELDDMQYLVRINGCTMLYSLLRGQVAMITGSFPDGKFNLPSILMHDKIMQIEKKKEKKLEQGKNKNLKDRE